MEIADNTEECRFRRAFMQHAKPFNINKLMKRALSFVLCIAMLMGMVVYVAPEVEAAYSYNSNAYWFDGTGCCFYMNNGTNNCLNTASNYTVGSGRYITLGTSLTSFNVANNVSVNYKQYFTVVYKSSTAQTLNVRIKQQHDHGGRTSDYSLSLKAGNSWQYATFKYNGLSACNKGQNPCIEIGGWSFWGASVEIAGVMFSSTATPNSTNINDIIDNASTAASYTVSYNVNGGSGAPSSQTKYYGKSLTLSSTTPTRTGYTFGGWNTNSSGTGTNYSAGGSYTANASVTLYAKWTANTYTVTYDGNGGLWDGKETWVDNNKATYYKHKEKCNKS